MELDCPDGWQLVSLRELGEVNRGRSRHRPRYAEHLYGGPYPFIQTGDVKASNGRVTSHTQTYSEAGLAQSRLWPVGTMCITIAANIAETGILTFPACFPDSVVGFIADPKKADVQFVEYMFRFMRSRIQHQATGSVQDNINIDTLERLRFPFPPLAEQKAIAAVLGALDDKIELNRRMNATLEAMARALFQSWFVDFDPVRAKLDGRHPAGIDSETAPLFPSSFEESSTGPIPQGWKSTTLGDVCDAGGGDIQTGPFGALLHAADYVSDGIPSIMPSDLRDNRIDPSAIARIREVDAARLSRYLVHTGDVVYSRRGDVERRSLIRQAEDGWLCGTGCLRVRFGDQGLSSHFAAAYLGTLESRAWVVRHAVGATMPNLNTSILRELPMVVPPQQLQKRFGDIIGSWDEIGTIALEQSRTLATLRDTLLPKLLSGELSVAGATTFISDTAR